MEKESRNIEIVRYSQGLKQTWDDFVESSKNGTFLFKRDYMDYHADRFEDFSLLAYRKGKLYCLLPTNIKDSVLYSHQGLTYGGLVMSEKCTAEGILDVFDSLINMLKERGIQKMVYKPVPYIYSMIPSQEDLYALFRNGATLNGCNISSTIDLEREIRFNKDRREAVRRAERAGIEVKESDNFETFWKILDDNLLTTYGARPVHTLEEMTRLKDLFPENIKLFCAFKGGEAVGGSVVYLSKNVAHAQYISATPEGKKMGAVDAVISYLLVKGIKEFNSEIRWFDLGTSNMDGGHILNETLIYQKEGFGGRGVCYQTWQLE